MQPPAIRLRAILPTDTPSLSALFGRLSAQEIRWRFLATLSEISHSQLQAWCEPDGVTHVAFVAVTDHEIIGVARAFIEPTGAAEFAILVESAAAGRGVGRALMHRLTEALVALDVQHMSARVAVDNHRMHTFLRAQGFACRADGAWDAMTWDRRLTLAPSIHLPLTLINFGVLLNLPNPS